MTSIIIKNHLVKMKEEGKQDSEFIDALFKSNQQDEEGEVTAARIIEIISEKYAKSKKSKA